MTRQHALFTATLAAGICLGAAPAMAGMGIPAPEAGIGLGAMALIGTGYLYLKRRISRR
ncbi:MAG: hypothetical protein QOJ53_2007 [Sphingomonadales bacterium]|jgi:hypothetical protein|nr:hypothetical protein [Sphingomonadales bacterium]MEA3042210.1 hypothetical protein [Sphingomonadales bacterium]MEA3047675.1 hypothetical protein [Sphingomonadales bacterium]